MIYPDAIVLVVVARRSIYHGTHRDVDIVITEAIVHFKIIKIIM